MVVIHGNLSSNAVTVFVAPKGPVEASQAGLPAQLWVPGPIPPGIAFLLGICCRRNFRRSFGSHCCDLLACFSHL